MTKTEQVNEWITILTMLREKSSLFRDEKLCEIIEFLRQARTNEMLSTPSKAEPIFPGPTKAVVSAVEALNKEVAALSHGVLELRIEFKEQKKRIHILEQS